MLLNKLNFKEIQLGGNSIEINNKIREIIKNKKKDLKIILLDVFDSEYSGIITTNSDNENYQIDIFLIDSEPINGLEKIKIDSKNEYLKKLEELDIVKLKIETDIYSDLDIVEEQIESDDLVKVAEEEISSSEKIYNQLKDNNKTDITYQELFNSLYSAFEGLKPTKTQHQKDILSNRIDDLITYVDLVYQMEDGPILRGGVNNVFFQNYITPVVYDTKNIYIENPVETLNNGTGLNIINSGIESSDNNGIFTLQQWIDCYSSAYKNRNNKISSCVNIKCPKSNLDINQKEWNGEKLLPETIFSKNYYDSSCYKRDLNGLMLSYKRYLKLQNQGGILKYSTTNSDAYVDYKIENYLNRSYINNAVDNQSNPNFSCIKGFVNNIDEDDEWVLDDSSNQSLWNDIENKYSYYRSSIGINQDCNILKFCSESLPSSSINSITYDNENGNRFSNSSKIKSISISNITKPYKRFAFGPTYIFSDVVDKEEIKGKTCDGSATREDILYKNKEITKEGGGEAFWIPTGKEFGNKINQPPNKVKLVDGENLHIIGYSWNNYQKNFLNFSQYLETDIQLSYKNNSRLVDTISNGTQNIWDIVKSGNHRLNKNTNELVESDINFINDQNQVILFNSILPETVITKTQNDRILSTIIPTTNNVLNNLLNQDKLDCGNYYEVDKKLLPFGLSLEYLKNDHELNRRLKYTFYQYSCKQSNNSNYRVKLLEEIRSLKLTFKEYDISLLNLFKSIDIPIWYTLIQMIQVIDPLLESFIKDNSIVLLYEYLVYLDLLKPLTDMQFELNLCSKRNKSVWNDINKYFKDIYQKSYDIRDQTQNNIHKNIVKRILSVYLIKTYNTNNRDSQYINSYLGYGDNNDLDMLNLYYPIAFPYRTYPNYYNKNRSSLNLYDIQLISITKFFKNSSDYGNTANVILNQHYMNKISNINSDNLNQTKISLEKEKQVYESIYETFKSKFVDDVQKKIRCGNKKIVKIYDTIEELRLDDNKVIKIDYEKDDLIKDLKLISSNDILPFLVAKEKYDIFERSLSDTKIIDQSTSNDIINLTLDRQRQKLNEALIQVKDSLEIKIKNKILDNDLLSFQNIDKRVINIMSIIENKSNLEINQIKKWSEIEKYISDVKAGELCLLNENKNLYIRDNNTWILHKKDTDVSEEDICEVFELTLENQSVNNLKKINCIYSKTIQKCLNLNLYQQLSILLQKKGQLLELKAQIQKIEYLNKNNKCEAEIKQINWDGSIDLLIDSKLYTRIPKNSRYLYDIANLEKLKLFQIIEVKYGNIKLLISSRKLKQNKKLNSLCKEYSTRNLLLQKISINKKPNYNPEDNYITLLKTQFSNIQNILNKDEKYVLTNNFINKYGTIPSLGNNLQFTIINNKTNNSVSINLNKYNLINKKYLLEALTNELNSLYHINSIDNIFEFKQKDGDEFKIICENQDTSNLLGLSVGVNVSKNGVLESNKVKELSHFNNIYYKSNTTQLLCCQHHLLQSQTAWKDYEIKNNLNKVLYKKWGYIDNGNYVCVNCGEVLGKIDLQSDSNFDEDGRKIQNIESSKSLEEQRLDNNKLQLNQNQSHIYNTYIKSIVNQEILISPELSIDSITNIVNNLSTTIYNLPTYSNYLKNLKTFKIPTSTKSLNKLIKKYIFISTDIKKNKKNEEKIDNLIKNISKRKSKKKKTKITEKSKDILGGSGQSSKNILNKPVTHYLEELNNYPELLDYNSLEVEITSNNLLNILFKTNDSTMSLLDNETLFKEKYTLCFFILGSYGEYTKNVKDFNIQKESIIEIIIELFLAIPDYDVSIKNAREIGPVMWDTFPKDLLQKLPNLQNETEKISDTIFSGGQTQFIINMSKYLTNNFPNIGNKKGIQDDLTEEIAIKLIHKSNYNRLLNKCKWNNTVLDEVSMQINEWVHFKPTLVNTSLNENIIELISNYNEQINKGQKQDILNKFLSTLDILASSKNNLSSNKSILMIKLLNYLVNNSEDSFIRIIKSDNRVNSCCPYRLNKTFSDANIFVKLLLNFSKSKIFSIENTSQKFKSLPLQTLNNLNYYYYCNTIKYYINDHSVINSIQERISDLYYNYSFDEDNIGKQRIYKTIYFNIWEQENSEILDQKIKELLRILNRDPKEDFQSIKLNILKNNGILHLDLITDKFRYEITDEIYNIITTTDTNKLSTKLEEMKQQISLSSIIYDTNKKYCNNHNDYLSSEQKYILDLRLYKTILEKMNKNINSFFKDLNGEEDRIKVNVLPDLIEQIDIKIDNPVSKEDINFDIIKNTTTKMNETIIRICEDGVLNSKKRIDTKFIQNLKLFSSISNFNTKIKEDVSKVAINYQSLSTYSSNEIDNAQSIILKNLERENMRDIDETITNNEKELIRIFEQYITKEKMNQLNIIGRILLQLNTKGNILINSISSLNKDESDNNISDTEKITEDNLDLKTDRLFAWLSSSLDKNICFTNYFELIPFNINTINDNFENQFLTINDGIILGNYLLTLNLLILFKSCIYSTSKNPDIISNSQDTINVEQFNIIYSIIGSVLDNISYVESITDEILEKSEKQDSDMKQQRNIKRLNNLDEDARNTQKIFRKFGLGEKFSSYLKDDEPEQQKLGTNDLLMAVTDSPRDIQRNDDGSILTMNSTNDEGFLIDPGMYEENEAIQLEKGEEDDDFY